MERQARDGWMAVLGGAVRGFMALALTLPLLFFLASPAVPASSITVTVAGKAVIFAPPVYDATLESSVSRYSFEGNGGPTDLEVVSAKDGALILGANMAPVSANQAPKPKVTAVVAAAGHEYVLVDNRGDYVLLLIRHVLRTGIQVSFVYGHPVAASTPSKPATSTTAGGTVVRVGGHVLVFPGIPRHAVLANATEGGMVSLHGPTFDFETGVPGMELKLTSATPELLGDIGVIPPEGVLSSWPAGASVTVRLGETLLVVDGQGAFAWVKITGVV